MQEEKKASMESINNMVPHATAIEDHSDYVTGDEGEDELKQETKEEKVGADGLQAVRKFPKLPKFPRLRSPDELPQFFILVETMLFQDGFGEPALDLLRIKAEIIASFVDCDELYRTATLLISKPWTELKRYLLHSFAGTARMRAEANARISQLKFDRDLIANRIRSLYDWFSMHDSAMSSHEFVTRVFTGKIFPARYLERIIERAELRFPHVNWRRVSIWDLCDVVEEVCLLMSELDAVNPSSRGSETTRRVSSTQRSSWLESWVKGFAKVLYVSDAQVAAQLGEKCDDSKKLFSKKHSHHYFLIGFKDAKVAAEAAKAFDEKAVREFQLKKPKN